MKDFTEENLLSTLPRYMSNDEGNNFIMKIHTFLIIFDFIKICVSAQANISIDNGATDPNTFLRGKRQLPEYTRWQSNLATTKGEFIVKVDDDTFNPTTADPKQIVAINIQQGTPAVDRIIVGGAMVPLLPTTASTEISAVEYTRFVPPTTVKATAGVDDIIYPQIKAVQGHMPPFSLAKHANRDDSPPAGPRFISRTPALEQQYAPITPVAFYPRVAASPLTPPSVMHSPSRSPSPPEIDYRRTTLKADGFDILPPLSGDAQELKDFLAPVERDEIRSDEGATRTSSPDFSTTFPTRSEETEIIPTKTTGLDLDPFNVMFYNDEDNEVIDSKKKVPEPAGDDNKTKKPVNSAEKEELEEDADNYDIDLKDSVRRNKGSHSVLNAIDNNTLDSSEELSTIPKISKLVDSQHHPVCSLLKFSSLGFNKPQTLPEIVLQLKKWADSSPLVKLIDITANNFTTMDNPIHMVVVDDPSSGQVVSAKDIVMIIAGIQGRDHHAVTAAMYVLHQLIERTEVHTDLLKKYRFWIIPIFNPDGYDYSMTFTQRREWTKNLHQSWEECGDQRSCKDCETHGLRCIVQPCYGVHLDRNFEYQWIPAEELRAEHPCGDLYAGSRQLSERETRALTTFLHSQRTPLAMFIAFKEGDVLGVMYPYSHTRKKRAFDASYRKRASRAASAAYSISGRPYVAGQTSEFLPLYAGGIEDWVDGHLGIDNTYTIMMFRPSDSYNSRLITEHVIHEAYAALDTLLMETGEPLTAEAFRPRTESGTETISASSIVFLTTTIPILNSWMGT